jgi:hypothetical protein
MKQYLIAGLLIAGLVTPVLADATKAMKGMSECKA